MALRVLHLSLKDQQTSTEAIPTEVEQHYLGGRGLATWLLATRLESDISPASPDNLLIFSAGALAGSLPIAGGGFCVTTRSPLTGLTAHSWGLGRWGATLRRAGLDALTITGRSPEWCLIQIDDGQVQIRSAEHLLGQDTVMTVRILQQELGSEYAITCVGPAGESGVAISCIVADGSYPAEPAGTGAVMAHKRIKAIAVRGTQQLRPAEERRLEPVLASINRRLSSSSVAADVRQYGSLYLLPRAIASGALTGRNGQDSEMGFALSYAPANLSQRGKREPRGCETCPAGCHSTYIRKNGDSLAYPELEAVAGFGWRCGVANPDAVIVINDLCLRLGLDVSETSAAVSFMMECQENRLSNSDNLPWGDSDAVLQAIRRLGQRQEKRDVLSLGVGEIQEIYYGSAAFAPQVKGLAMPALDPRALDGIALAMAVSSCGGDYRYAMYYDELLPEPPAWLPDDPNNPQSIRSKPARLIWHERFCAAIDAAGICRRLALLAYQIAPAEVTELLNATLGRSFTNVDVLKVGDRIVALERWLACQVGAETDTLPKRWRTEEFFDGPAAEHLPPLDELIAEYYRRHGWTETGELPPARIAELHLPGTA